MPENSMMEISQYLQTMVAIVINTPAIKVARAASNQCCELEKPRKPSRNAFRNESNMANVAAISETTNQGASNRINVGCAYGILDNSPALKASVPTKAIGNIAGVASPDQRICCAYASQKCGSKMVSIKRNNRSGLHQIVRAG